MTSTARKKQAGGIARATLWYIILGIIAVLMIYPLIFSSLSSTA